MGGKQTEVQFDDVGVRLILGFRFEEARNAATWVQRRRRCEQVKEKEEFWELGEHHVHKCHRSVEEEEIGVEGTGMVKMVMMHWLCLQRF